MARKIDLRHLVTNNLNFTNLNWIIFQTLSFKFILFFLECKTMQKGWTQKVIGAPGVLGLRYQILKSTKESILNRFLIENIKFWFKAECRMGSENLPQAGTPPPPQPMPISNKPTHHPPHWNLNVWISFNICIYCTGWPKKMSHSVFELKSVLNVGLDFSACVLESEFWARFI